MDIDPEITALRNNHLQEFTAQIDLYIGLALMKIGVLDCKRQGVKIII